MVAKVGHHQGELFPRVGYIVTNLSLPSRAVVRFYNRRGTAEQWIKESKQAVKMTRLSCHRFRFNEVRPWLSVLAYNLQNLWRRLVLPKKEDRLLVADQLATATGEDGWPTGDARLVLLVADSGRASDAAGVRGDIAEDLGAAPTERIGRGGGEGNSLKGGGWNGEVYEKSLTIG